MNPGDEKTLTIARRSRKNLEFIYEQKHKGADVEEFTQLLNSMLGMLICLREDYFKGRKVTWEEVESKGLQRVAIQETKPHVFSPELKTSNMFSKLISNMRHAFAHNNFELLGRPEITGVKVWNNTAKKSKGRRWRTWEAELSEEQLKALAYLFIDYLEAELGRHAPLT
jgi:hypothetical protein